MGKKRKISQLDTRFDSPRLGGPFLQKESEVLHFPFAWLRLLRLGAAWLVESGPMALVTGGWLHQSPKHLSEINWCLASLLWGMIHTLW